MAIVSEMLVPGASRADADLLDASVEQTFKHSGGPPAGLMVHLVRPEGDGFLMVDVWRSEEEMQAFLEEVVRPRLAAGGLSAGEPRVSPVWSLGRP